MNHAGVLNQSSNSLPKRPIAITVICIFGFMGSGLSIPMVFSEVAMQIGRWFPPYSGFVAFVSLVCMIGLWYTRRWAAYAYFSLVVINQIVLITMGKWNMLTLIIQVVIVIITLSYLDDNVGSISRKSLRYVRRQIWAIIVAYMLGIHNFYREEDKTPEDIGIVKEDPKAQESSAPKGR